jgi:hypothetical protein
MRSMTWWQFNETVDGWTNANSPNKDEGLSEIEERGLAAILDAPI